MSARAFVVMQVGEKDSPERKRADEIFKFVIAPALDQFEIEAYRADLDPTPGSITSRLLGELLEARLVIADLTGRNPNVFYELGIVHSFGRPLISIADSASNLPFDTKDERVIALGEYSTAGLTYAQGEEAKRALLASLAIVVDEDYVPPSPLRDVAANRSIDQLAPDNPVAAELAQMRETLVDIRQRVSARATSDWRRADVQAMQQLIEKLVDAGVIGPDDVLSMLNPLTSPLHDMWVQSLQNRVDPWGTPMAPGRTADEPPF